MPPENKKRYGAGEQQPIHGINVRRVVYRKSMPTTAAPLFQNVAFEFSVANLRQLPEDDLPEVAFAGRSNAGKSSAINTLCRRRNLARTSRTPGRTQLLNLFRLGDIARLVDLPGYGYARVPEPMRRGWKKLISGYLERSANLVGVILIMDSRHPLTDFDRTMLDWCEAQGLPVHVLLTKADKLSKSAAALTLRKVRKEIPMASLQMFSAKDRRGVTELEQQMAAWLTPQEQLFVDADEVDAAP